MKRRKNDSINEKNRRVSPHAINNQRIPSLTKEQPIKLCTDYACKHLNSLNYENLLVSV